MNTITRFLAAAATPAPMDPVAWSRNANIYEVNIRQFTREGTIKAFSAHLPRLKKMGVDILWIMPVQPIGQKNRKGTLGSYYAVRDYTAVNPAFGTLGDFKEMVAQAHNLGMRVILDWVANRAGIRHDVRLGAGRHLQEDRQRQGRCARHCGLHRQAEKNLPLARDPHAVYEQSRLQFLARHRPRLVWTGLQGAVGSRGHAARHAAHLQRPGVGPGQAAGVF